MPKMSEFEPETAENLEGMQKIHKACEVVTDLSYELSDLASAFNYTGNLVVGRQLKEIAEMLRQNALYAREGVGQMLSHEVMLAGERSGLLLKAALAGAIGASDASKKKALTPVAKAVLGGDGDA